MKKFMTILGVAVTLISCEQKAETTMTSNEANVKIDSLIGVRLTDLSTQSSEDLDRRISIEVKPKADSIFNAWKAAGGK